PAARPENWPAASGGNSIRARPGPPRPGRICGAETRAPAAGRPGSRRPPFRRFQPKSQPGRTAGLQAGARRGSGGAARRAARPWRGGPGAHCFSGTQKPPSGRGRQWLPSRRRGAGAARQWPPLFA
nr:hypothetical protein [Tanacetum cinerariifolium]